MRPLARRLSSLCTASLFIPLAVHCSANRGPEPVRDTIVFEAGGLRIDAGSDATADGNAGTVEVGPPPACYDETLARIYTTGNPRARQNKCTNKQRVDYFGACFDPTTQSNTACGAFYKDEANQACIRCMTGPRDADGPSASFPDPVIFAFSTGEGQELQLLNRIGCQALAAGSPDCGKKLGTLEVCAISSCRSCSFGSAQDDCIAFSKAVGICNDIIAGALCENTIENGRPLANAKCGADGLTFGETYDKVSSYFCGP